MIYVPPRTHTPIQSLLRYSGQLNTKRHFQGEDWQLDFTQMPHDQDVSIFRVFADNFTEWAEAFPIGSE